MKEDESLKTSLVKFYSYFIYLHALESYCPNHPSMEILRVEKRTIETLIHQKSGTCLSVLSTRSLTENRIISLLEIFLNRGYDIDV